jgi:hypothetical protein
MRKTIQAGSLKNNFTINIKYFGLTYGIKKQQALTPVKTGPINSTVVCCLILAGLLLVSSCASLKTYDIYADNMFIGKKFLKEQEYADAEPYFAKASMQIRDSVSLAYLATVSYKMNNLDIAESYVVEAEKLDNNTYAYLRIIGYKALILLKKEKQKGLDILKDYINLYQYLYPLMTIKDIKKMYDKKEIDSVRLEKLMDEQILMYENDIEQFLGTKTGFYDRNSGAAF